MNCKQGDLAMIVYSVAGNEGKIVSVGRFIGNVPGFAGCNRWEIDRPLPARHIYSKRDGGSAAHIEDANLRPIRDNPGNESFVTQARKSLPRPKDVVTITSRGEIA